MCGPERKPGVRNDRAPVGHRAAGASSSSDRTGGHAFVELQSHPRPFAFDLIERGGGHDRHRSRSATQVRMIARL